MSIVSIRSALESALDAMVGIIPSVAINKSDLGTVTIFTTAVPHLLVTGLNVTISDHTDAVPSLNGSYVVTVISATTFSLRTVTTASAIASTANGVGGVVRANLTAWEGIAFKPVAGVPYQQVHLISAAPESPSFGDSHYREIGFLQVTLYYPKQVGTRDVMTRAELIRSTFPRGGSFIKDSIIVQIPNRAEIISGLIDAENFVVPVRIPYWADVFN